MQGTESGQNPTVTDDILNSERTRNASIQTQEDAEGHIDELNEELQENENRNNSISVGNNTDFLETGEKLTQYEQLNENNKDKVKRKIRCSKDKLKSENEGKKMSTFSKDKKEATTDELNEVVQENENRKTSISVGSNTDRLDKEEKETQYEELNNNNKSSKNVVEGKKMSTFNEDLKEATKAELNEIVQENENRKTSISVGNNTDSLNKKEKEAQYEQANNNNKSNVKDTKCCKDDKPKSENVVGTKMATFNTITKKAITENELNANNIQNDTKISQKLDKEKISNVNETKNNVNVQTEICFVSSPGHILTLVNDNNLKDNEGISKV